MAYCLLGAKPLPKPMQPNCQLDSLGEIRNEMQQHSINKIHLKLSSETIWPLWYKEVIAIGFFHSYYKRWSKCQRQSHNGLTMGENIEFGVMVFIRVNTLRPRQNGRHFQTTFSNVFSWLKMYDFRLQFHLSSFLRIQYSSIVSVGAKPLSEPMVVESLDAYVRHSASMS